MKRILSVLILFLFGQISFGQSSADRTREIAKEIQSFQDHEAKIDAALVAAKLVEGSIFQNPRFISTMALDSYENGIHGSQLDPRKVVDGEFILKNNKSKLAGELHHFRYGALISAYAALKKQKNTDPILLRNFFALLTETALAEKDQGNTAFTKEGIMSSFKDFSREPGAIKDYFGVMSTYRELLEHPDRSASPKVFKEAAKKYFANGYSPELSGPKQVAFFARCGLIREDLPPVVARLATP